MIIKYLLSFFLIVLSFNFSLFAQNTNAGKTMPVEGFRQGKTSQGNNQNTNNTNAQSLQEEKVYGFGYSFTQKTGLLTNEQRAQFPDGYTKEKILYISNILEAVKNSKQFWDPINSDIPWSGFFSKISIAGKYDDYAKSTFGWYDNQTVNNKRNALISDFQQKGFRVVYISNFYFKQKERVISSEIKQTPQAENRQLQLTAGGSKPTGKETATTNKAATASKNSDDFWDTPENSTTKQEVREAEAQKYKEEEEQRQEELRAVAREREQALLNPYVLNNVTDRDTVYENSMQLIQSLNPMLQNPIVTVSWTNTKTNQSTTVTGIDQPVTLTEGWNKFNIVVWENNKPLRSSVRLFFKKGGRKILFNADFNDGVFPENINLTEHKAYIKRCPACGPVLSIEDGILICTTSINFPHYIKIALDNIDVTRNIIIECKAFFKNFCRACGHESRIEILMNDNRYSDMPFTENDDKWENIKIIYDFKNKMEYRYINGKLINSLKLSSSLTNEAKICITGDYMDKIKIDNLLIYQE